jgi:type IV pilus assembly protein PilP
LWGCDNSTTVPAKPKVVRKKIVAPRQKTVKVSKAKTVRQAKTKPIAKPQTKTVIAKVDKKRPPAVKQQPAANKKTENRQPAGRRNNSGANSDKPAVQSVSKKPAISPKSEITEIKPPAKKEIKPPVKKQMRPDSGSTVAGKKSPTPKPVTVASLMPGSVPRLYNPAGKIDPFEPLFREKSTMPKKKKQIKREPRTPLERIDLSQLKLVGIILASSGNRAIVEESSGKGYVVKTGTYIGINGGKIVNIDKELITVEEQFEDVFGKIQTQKRKLKLPKPPGEF